MSDLIVLFLVCAFACVVLVALVTCEVWKRLRWIRTSAVVVRYVIQRGSEGRYFAPVVRFEAKDGRQIVTIAASGSWRRPWRRGDLLTVRYDPHQPRHCDQVTFASIWGPILTAIAMIVIVALAASFWPGL
jgi:hypothetical protein